MYSRNDLTKTTLAAAVLLALGVGTANAGTTTGNNFTMVSGSGGLTGGTNDVKFTWDGTLRTSVVTDGTINVSELSSITPFSGYVWTAHHVNIYAPGTYVFDTTCVATSTTDTSYNPSCGSGTASQKYTLTVPAGYVGAHMLFNWSTSTNIDVVELWKFNDSWANVSQTFSSTAAGVCGAAQPVALTAPCTMKNPMSYGTPNPNGNTIDTVWKLVSIDTDQDTDVNNGSKMVDGPFKGQSANFNLKLDDYTPTLSTFPSKTVALSTLTESDPITVNGTAGYVYAISATGTGGEYAIGTAGTYAAYTTSGTVIVGQTVKARHTSSSASGTSMDTILTIGDVTRTFTTTTVGVAAPDTTPDPFSFSARSGVALSTVITSDTITVNGINTAATISVSGGEYSINGGTYASAGTTVSNNNTVAVRHTSSSANSTATTTTLTIGGVPGTFTSTTVVAAAAVVDVADPKMPGCSIANTTAVQPSDRAEWWLVAGFLALLGILRRRRV